MDDLFAAWIPDAAAPEVDFAGVEAVVAYSTYCGYQPTHLDVTAAYAVEESLTLKIVQYSPDVVQQAYSRPYNVITIEAKGYRSVTAEASLGSSSDWDTEW